MYPCARFTYHKPIFDPVRGHRLLLDIEWLQRAGEYIETARNCMRILLLEVYSRQPPKVCNSFSPVRKEMLGEPLCFHWGSHLLTTNAS